MRTTAKMASRTAVAALARNVATRKSVVGAARSQQAVLRTCVASSSRSYAHAAPKPAAPVVPARRKVGAEPIPKIASKDSYDIVIIGAGNAGLALACALLSKQSIADTSRILLVEGGSLDKVRSWTGDGHWENRVSSITAENVDWLREIGAWEHIEASRPCPVEEMIIWSNPSRNSNPTLHFPQLDHPMAYMTENTNLQRALLRRLEKAGKGKVDIRENARVQEMRYGDGQRWVGLQIGDKGEWVRGGVVVGADGHNSPVRTFSEIQSRGHAYPTHAVVATMNHDEPISFPNNTAFQRFLPTGPLAFLPLSPTASTMVWSTTPELAKAIKQLDVEALTQVVNAGYGIAEADLMHLNEQLLTAPEPLSAMAVRRIIASFPRSTTPIEDQPILPPYVTSIEARSVASFPLKLSHADRYIGERTVLVGDAAHTCHPLAGQGLNMGLADVRELTNHWDEIRKSGGDFGAYTSLKGYPATRYSANQLLLNTTDFLHHIFSNRSEPVNWARGVGLEVINEIEPLKRILMGGAGAKIGAGKGTGWPAKVADGLEGWLGFKGAVGMMAGMAGQALKDRASQVLGGQKK